MVVLVCGDVEVVSWPLTGCGRPELGSVDELARLQLVARRLGCSIRLRDARVELLELLNLVGLADAVIHGALRQVGGEGEGREQVGVDEVVVPDDSGCLVCHRCFPLARPSMHREMDVARRANSSVPPAVAGPSRYRGVPRSLTYTRSVSKGRAHPALPGMTGGRTMSGDAR